MSNGIGRLYTKDFTEIKKSDKIALTIAIISLIISLIALYLSFGGKEISKERIQSCNEMAITFEKSRHPNGDLEITNQDISIYLKNIIACLSDSTD